MIWWKDFLKVKKGKVIITSILFFLFIPLWGESRIVGYCEKDI